MTVSEALRCVEDGESGTIGITLAVEVRRLQLIVSGKTQYDVELATAHKCRDILAALFMEHQNTWRHSESLGYQRGANAIAKEFNLSD